MLKSLFLENDLEFGENALGDTFCFRGDTFQTCLCAMNSSDTTGFTGYSKLQFFNLSIKVSFPVLGVTLGINSHFQCWGYTKIPVLGLH